MELSLVISLLLICFTLASPLERRSNSSSLSNEKTSLTLLYQNNLNETDDANHVGAILLDPMSSGEAEQACAALGESLLSEATIEAHLDDFFKSLSYVEYSSNEWQGQYLIAGGVFTVKSNYAHIASNASSRGDLPVLCTQSSNQHGTTDAKATSSNELTLTSNSNTFVGFRNQKSFRFLGIRYANPPERFLYSSLYAPTGQTIQAIQYGSSCAQVGSGSEDCLYLNIQTPYIPKSGSQERLRPVLFWIHGGGFTGGSGSDPLSDGGDLASREDIVVVTINYRLSTLGFLTVPGTNVTGNYGIADQTVALDWTIQNIASFGGDPNRMTIVGESAGAGSVRTLLGSPKAIGKYEGAIAMSNLGGGVTLNLTGDYGTTYSSYLTPDASYAIAGQQIFHGVGCNQTSLDAQVDCLRNANATAIVNEPTVARYVTQDGVYVNTENLDVVNQNGSAAHVPTIWGNAANDGASFSTYPTTPVSNETQGLMVGLGISAAEAQRVIQSGLFPYYDTGNITLDSFNVTQHVATDKTFRCVDQATVYAGTQSGAFQSSYYYQFDRTEGGYDPNHVGNIKTNDSDLPYFRLHGADMPWLFGGLSVLRNADDLRSLHVTTSYFASFVKTGNPNADLEYLKVRGYTDVIEARQAWGEWEPVQGANGPIRRLDWPTVSTPFVDVPQCDWLGYPLDYYLKGGRRR